MSRGLGDVYKRQAQHPRFQPSAEHRKRFFIAQGVIVGDGGVWLRRQCLAMARTNNTPVDFWLSLRLGEFSQWVKASNALIAEEMEKRKQKRK